MLILPLPEEAERENPGWAVEVELVKNGERREKLADPLLPPLAARVGVYVPGKRRARDPVVVEFAVDAGSVRIAPAVSIDGRQCQPDSSSFQLQTHLSPTHYPGYILPVENRRCLPSVAHLQLVHRRML